MARRNVTIDYTSRDFDSIRDDLVNYAKRYYPDTFKDFSEASFGSLMIDTVAYVGDQLSFYLDYQTNESFLTDVIDKIIAKEEGTVEGMSVGEHPKAYDESNSVRNKKYEVLTWIKRYWLLVELAWLVSIYNKYYQKLNTSVLKIVT